MLTAGDRGTKKLELREANGIILAQATTQMSLSMDSKLWIYKVWIAWQGSLRCISLILTTCQVQLNLYQTIYISYKWTLFLRWHTHFYQIFNKHNLKGGELELYSLSALVVSCQMSVQGKYDITATSSDEGEIQYLQQRNGLYTAILEVATSWQ